MRFSVVINAFEGKRPVHFRGEMNFRYRPQYIAIQALRLEGNPERKMFVAEVLADIAQDHDETNEFALSGTILARSRDAEIVKILERKRGWKKGEGSKSIHTLFVEDNAVPEAKVA